MVKDSSQSAMAWVSVMSPGEGDIAWLHTLDDRNQSTVSLQCQGQETWCPVDKIIIFNYVSAI